MSADRASPADPPQRGGATPPGEGRITDVAGLRVGHWSSRRRATGVTVVLTPPDTVGGVDVLPTRLELVGVEAPPALEGQSLVPTEGTPEGAPRPRFVIGDRHSALFGKSRRSAPYENPLQISMELDGAKVLHDFSKRRTVYFDLTVDPREEKPLTTPPVELVPPLGRRLVNWYRALPKYEAKSSTVLSEEDVKQLQSLGYID